MRGKDPAEILVIDDEFVFPPLYPADFIRVPVRDTETTAFIINETVKGDQPPGAQVKHELLGGIQTACSLHAFPLVFLVWDTVDRAMVAAVLGTAPCKSLIIKLRDVAEDPAGDKVVFYRLSEHSDNGCYPQFFIIRTFPENAVVMRVIR